MQLAEVCRHTASQVPVSHQYTTKLHVRRTQAVCISCSSRRRASEFSNQKMNNFELGPVLVAGKLSRVMFDNWIDEVRDPR
jgi:hypothetical protein